MFAESLVRRPVVFLMIATAVEDHETTFAGVEASLGFTDRALILVGEGSGGCRLVWVTWWSKESDKSSMSGMLGKRDIEGVEAYLGGIGLVS